MAAGCANLRPEDAAPATGIQVDPALAAQFPGADATAVGYERSGEPALRDGDRLLLGVEIVLDQDITRHLLEVVVRRRDLGRDLVRVRFTNSADESGEPPPVSVPNRYSRLVDLEFVLRTPGGLEVQRSSVRGVPDFVLDESFVPAVGLALESRSPLTLIAYLRLLHVAQMLNDDPILQSLLQQAASLPMDVSLLWRRELQLVPYFDQGRMLGDGSNLNELPFDLFLNDSLLVRLMATVTDPHGPTCAFGGIVALRAQDARDPKRHVRVQVLGATRGPASDWQRHGVLAAYGYADEGKGLAFSPGGRWAAMPGFGSEVLLHDLGAVAPGAAVALPCAGRAVSLACLDEGTLLVASKDALQVFDVASLGSPVLLATHRVAEFEVCAVDVAGDGAVFVGGNGYAVARWRFDQDRRVAPVRELVQGVQREKISISLGEHEPAATAALMTRAPECGWLWARDPDRVVVRSHAAVAEWSRAADSSWKPRTLDVDPAKPGWRGLVDPAQLMARGRVAVGESLVCPEKAGAHAWRGGRHSLTGGRTRMLSSLAPAGDFSHGFSPDGRFYAYVAPGYRILVDVERFLAAGE